MSVRRFDPNTLSISVARGPTQLGLSAKLLVLTILFVMLAEVLIYLPSVANFRRNWLNDRVAAAQIAVLVLEGSPAEGLPEGSEERLLAGLRIDQGVSFEDVSVLGLSPVHPEVGELIAAGLLAPDPDRLRATPAGRLILDHVTSRLAT